MITVTSENMTMTLMLCPVCRSIRKSLRMIVQTEGQNELCSLEILDVMRL
jgi:hypothetical protein